MFIRLLYLSFVCLFWVCWVRGNFSGGPGHIFSVCVCLCRVECRAGTILFVHFLGADGGTVQIFPFLWLCCSGYGTVEMVRGMVRVSFHFLQFAVSSLGGRISVVGLSFLQYRFSLVNMW